MTTITVTKWSSPGTSTLILKGTPADTREEAKAYFETYDSINGEQAEMDEEEFNKLPEFEG